MVRSGQRVCGTRRGRLGRGGAGSAGVVVGDEAFGGSVAPGVLEELAHLLLGDFGEVDAKADEEAAVSPDLFVDGGVGSGGGLGFCLVDADDRVCAALFQVGRSEEHTSE